MCRLVKIFLACVWVLFAGPVQAQTRNVIWVIADGLGPEIMGFWMQGVRYGKLTGFPDGVSALEMLMNQGTWGLFFTNTFDTIVTDSAAAATQMATGKFSRPLYVGVDAAGKPVPTVLEIARQQGKYVGVVSDAYVTDATPAAFTAHVPDRRQRKEIARAQIELAPEVILGGGEVYFSKALLRQAKQKEYQVVQTKKQLARASSAKKILGLFAEKGMPMAVEMPQYPSTPTLLDMTQKAVSVLEKNPKGFFLMVEAGKVDWAAHANDPGALLAEMRALDHTLAYLKEYVEKHPDTLLYINADHDTGLGTFVCHSVDKEQAAQRTAQGEALYGGNKDYASFAQYAKFEKQTRSLYSVYLELKALPAEQRTEELVGQKISQALGEKIDVRALGGVENLEQLFKQLNTTRGVAYATQSHSAAPIISIAYGAGENAFAGVYHNTDILPRLEKVWAQPTP